MHWKLSRVTSIVMVVINIKTRRVSDLRKATLLIAAASFFAICISVRWMHTNYTLRALHQGPITPPVNIVIHTSLCNEGPTSNISTTSLSKPTIERRRGDYPQYHHISQMVEGPALSATNVEDAVCRFRRIKYWNHFPHTYVLEYAKHLYLLTNFCP